MNVARLALVAALAVAAAPRPEQPLDAFERLVGGRWSFGFDPGHQEFSWGEAGRSALVARSFDAEGACTSEGMWYWNPGAETVQGVFTAPSMDMPLARYDACEWAGDVLTCRMTVYDAEGRETRYREVWSFTGEDSYDWTLHALTDDGERELMSGTATRTR